MVQLSDITRAWCAGLYEGEGSCSSSINRYPRVSINMTDLDVLERIQALTGLGKIYDYKQTQTGYPSKKQSWVWVISQASNAARFLRWILPLLGERRTGQVETVLDNYDTHLATGQIRPAYHPQLGDPRKGIIAQ